MEVSGQLDALTALPPRRKPQYLLDKRMGLDIVAKRRISAPAKK
jgi:hypothetical protein